MIAAFSAPPHRRKAGLLVSCLTDTRAKSIQLLENRIGSSGATKRLAAGVVAGDKLIDALDDLVDAGEHAATDGLIHDQREEARDLTEPRAVGRYEVHIPARLCSQPGLDPRMVVGGVVVNDTLAYTRSKLVRAASASGWSPPSDRA